MRTRPNCAQCTGPCQSEQQALRSMGTGMGPLNLSQDGYTKQRHCMAWLQSPSKPNIQHRLQLAISMTSACSMDLELSV